MVSKVLITRNAKPLILRMFIMLRGFEVNNRASGFPASKRGSQWMQQAVHDTDSISQEALKMINSFCETADSSKKLHHCGMDSWH